MIKLLPQSKGFPFRKENYSIGLFAFIFTLLFSVSAYSQVTIDSEDFEGGSFAGTIWNDGGTDCILTNGGTPNGTWSVDLQDNTSTSLMTTDDIDITSYTSIDFTFDYETISMESAEDFWIQYSDDGGSSFTTIATYAEGTDFSNNTPYTETVSIDTGSYTFSVNSQFRIRCDASGNGDDVYIDNILIEGYLSGTAFSNVTVSVDWPVYSSENTVEIYSPSAVLITTITDPTGTGNSNYSTTVDLGCLEDLNNYYFIMYDTANDGWDGADNITIIVDGTVVINQNGDAVTSGGITVNFNVSGTTAPEIEITGNSIEIVDGDNTPAISDKTDFGNVGVGSPSVTTFTINNLDCSSALTLSGASPYVVVSGTNAANFVVTVPFATTPIGANSSTTFEITFTPSAAGLRTATLTITSDDSNEGTYNFDIQGTGIAPLTEGPGGVTADLQLWLKGTDGLSYTNGQSVSLWADQGRGQDATVNTAGQEPTFKDNATDNVNFNPVVDFDNSYSPVALDGDYSFDDTSTEFLEGTGGFYTEDIFMVVIPDTTVDNSFGSMDLFCGDEDMGTDQTDATGIGFGAYTVRFTSEVISYAVGTTSSGAGYGVAETGGGTYSNVGIINTRNNSGATQQELYYNGEDIEDTQNDVPDFSNVDDSRYWIGRSEGWEASTDARIAEIITYSSRQSDVDFTDERNRIMSYLAIKYGITLHSGATTTETDIDYVDSSGAVIWDESVNSGYNYHIAGIGRDDDSDLNQKQSKTVNTSDDITMGLADIAATNSANANTFANDRNFIVWGNDQGTLAAQPAVVVNMSIGILPLTSLVSDVEFEAIGRTWKVVESGTVGTTKVSIPSSMLSLLGPPPGDYLMFISSDTNFDPTSEYRIMTLNGSDLETSYNFNGTKFITFGFAPERTFTRSIYFDGTNDYLDAGDVLDLTGSFSISAWIKRDAGTVNVDIVSKRDAASYTDGYSLRLDGTGRAQMFWKNSSGTTQQIQSTVIIPENEWHHIAVTYDGTNARIYIDGVIKNTETIALDPPVSNTERFIIGAANYSSPTRFFKGNIDEVRVWDVTLTEDQLHYIMNQEIEDNGGLKGSYFQSLNGGSGITPTKNDISGLGWGSLQAYYPMSTYTYTNAKDESDNGYTAALIQLTTVDHQTAPLPYVSSGATTDWDTNTTWTNGSEQTIPGATSIVNSNKTVDWNIVSTSHNITMDNSSLPAVKNDNRTLLALIVNSNELTIDGDATSGNGITISHYLELDGVMDLQGESQLIQTSSSDLATSSSGYIERDQQGTANSFTYNYFSSPVSTIGTAANNVAFNVEDILFDGTIPDDATRSIDFGADSDPYYSDGIVSDPIKITSYWLYKFVNQDNDYASWQWIGNDDTALNVAEGFTMKGISNVSSIATEQNYVFLGKPNNVLNGASQIVHTTFSGAFDTNGNAFTTLTGNPFPSAIDADQFITDNTSSIGGGSDGTTGTLYFWEHWGGDSHIWSQYQGGYATYTIAGGVAATSHPDVDQTGVGTKIPGQYIPVAQGFYVIQEHDDDGMGNLSNPSSGSVVFNNGQRVFQIETGNVESIFTKNSNTSQTNSITTDSGKQRIWLGFKSPDGYHRQILAAFLEGATDGIDRGYDGRAGSFLSNDAFFMQNEKYFVIQAFGELNEEREIPISIFIDADNDNGLQTFMIDKLENIPEDVGIYIKDNISGETFDIKDQNYEVNLATGEHKTRFSLVFKANSLSVDEADLLENGINAFMNNTTSTIDITKTVEVDINKVTLYNYLGQTIQIWTKNLSSNELNLPVNKTSTGAYILKIETENKTVSKKLIIE